MSVVKYKSLGQLACAATTLETLYTVPAGKNTVVSTISICNRSATATTFRLAHAVAGAADNVKQYLYYDMPLPGNDSFQVTGGISMEATDVLRVYAGAATVTAQAWGEEIQ